MLLLQKYNPDDLIVPNEQLRIPKHVSAAYEQKVFYQKGDYLLCLSSENPKEFTLQQYGMTPETGKYYITAEAEHVIRKKTFLRAIRSQWSVIPVSGILMENNKSELHAIWLGNQKLFSVGAIWDEFINPASGDKEMQFSIITLPAGRFLQDLGFSRMPLIFDPQYQHRWITKRHLRDVTAMFKPISDKCFNAVKCQIKDEKVYSTGQPLRSSSFFSSNVKKPRNNFRDIRYKRQQEIEDAEQTAKNKRQYD